MAQSPTPLLLYDGFNYTAGELLAPLTDTAGAPMPGQHNVEYNVDWRYTGPYNATPPPDEPPEITAGSLTATGLPASSGNSVLFDFSNLGAARIQIPDGPASGPRYYWSGLFKVNTLGNLISGLTETSASNGVYVAGFNTTVGAQASLPTAVGALLLVRPDFEVTPLEPKPDTYQIGTSVTTNNGDRVWASSSPLAVGSTVFLVASYESVAGANNDIVKMWINPSANTFGVAEDMLPAETLISPVPPNPGAGADLSTVATFVLRNNPNIYQNTNWQFDELRVGTTWASVTTAVTPPPPLAGDYDGNDVVDAADLTVWQGSFGNTGAGLPADGDDDGDVDGADFLIWQANLGAIAGGGVAAVPEPISLLMLGASWPLARAMNRRRRGPM
jgi:hypothetical protein